MIDQIKARGWLWDRSVTPTQWIAYKCLKCERIKTYPTIRKLEKYCEHCNKLLIPYCYVRKVKELK